MEREDGKQVPDPTVCIAFQFGVLGDNLNQAETQNTTTFLSNATACQQSPVDTFLCLAKNFLFIPLSPVLRKLSLIFNPDMYVIRNN